MIIVFGNHMNPSFRMTVIIKIIIKTVFYMGLLMPFPASDLPFKCKVAKLSVWKKFVSQTH